MGDGNNLFAFEILQELYKSQITKKEDVLILFVHWYLVKNEFRCIGIGDSKSVAPLESGSQLLPEGWNLRQHFAIRYLKENKLYLIHAIRSDEDLLINLLVEGQDVTCVQFPIDQTINNLNGPVESVIPTYQDVINLIQRDLIDPLCPSPSSTVETSTQTTSSLEREGLRPNPLRVPLPVPRRSPSPYGVGVSDLDPLGLGHAGGMGGMLFDPFARNRGNPPRPGLGVPGRLPPGAMPPFARFDPFGPPDIDHPMRRPRPRDPDNERIPPGGFDDMFM